GRGGAVPRLPAVGADAALGPLGRPAGDRGVLLGAAFRAHRSRSAGLAGTRDRAAARRSDVRVVRVVDEATVAVDHRPLAARRDRAGDPDAAGRAGRCVMPDPRRHDRRYLVRLVVAIVAYGLLLVVALTV